MKRGKAMPTDTQQLNRVAKASAAVAIGAPDSPMALAAVAMAAASAFTPSVLSSLSAD